MRTHFEQLEPRQLCTASVDLDAGTLRIVGGNQAEAVEVRQIDVDSFRVLGDVDAPGRYDGVARLEAALGGRNDALRVSGAGIPSSLPRGLEASLGAGRDTLEIVNLDLSGDSVLIPPRADLDLGGGRDSLEIADSSLVLLSVQGGTSNSRDAVAIADCVFGGDVSLLLGGGDDSLDIAGCTFLSALTADGGAGTDSLTEAGNSYAEAPMFLGFE